MMQLYRELEPGEERKLTDVFDSRKTPNIWLRPITPDEIIGDAVTSAVDFATAAAEARAEKAEAACAAKDEALILSRDNLAIYNTKHVLDAINAALSHDCGKAITITEELERLRASISEALATIPEDSGLPCVPILQSAVTPPKKQVRKLKCVVCMEDYHPGAPCP
jgi:hypothetical protein